MLARENGMTDDRREQTDAFLRRPMKSSGADVLTDPQRRETRPLHVVAIGASAGGIAALRAFFEAVPERSGIAFVVVMHLSPEHESQLAEVLQPAVRIPVRQVRDRTRLEPDHVYVIPPDRSMTLTDGHLELSDFEEPRGRRTPIDTFFRTVAQVHPDGVGVLLSGSGTDGVAGLKAIKELGGITMAQHPDEAEYDTMPGAAVASGLVDFVLPARDLGKRVVELRTRGPAWVAPADEDALEEADARRLRQILTQLKVRTGHDFTGFKKSTVLRRVGRRVQVSGSADLGAYLEYLERNGAEAQALLKDLLISVTSFFRDPEAFETLNRTVIPAVFNQADDGEVRVWVSGCATGEEAYGLAMLLAEHAETLADPPPFQVFATDLDVEALALAREGVYPDAVAADVGAERIRRFFTREGDTMVRVRRELRERILFSPHDLLRDPPFSRLHLLTCRNLLIYLEKELQDRVVSLFRYALLPEGFLFLGNSEGIPDNAGFRVCDREHRIFQRAREVGDDARLPDLPLRGGSAPRARQWPRGAAPWQAAGDADLHRRALEERAPPSVLVDADHTIVHVSESANRYLGFTAGSPSANLLKAALPPLREELRAALFHALEKGSPCRTRQMTVNRDGDEFRVQAYVAPAPVTEDGPMALVVFLEEATAAGEQPREPEEISADRLDGAEAELTAARERLQEMVEASEWRQEELRASNEELQSINEEYKSTLEQLETSKEELQSMNEELKTVNDELRLKVDELSHANDDLRNLMAATEIATLFLDRRLRVQRFTPALRLIFNVLPTDEGRPLDRLTHKLDYPGLVQDCETVLETLEAVEREVSDGGGHAWLARVTPYRTSEDEIRGVICTFTDVTRIREAQAHVRRSEERFRALVEATAEIVWTAAPNGTVVEDSPSWRAFTGQIMEERWGLGWTAAIHPDDRDRAVTDWRAAVQERAPLATEFRLRQAETGDWRVMAARAVPVLNPDSSVREWVCMSSDITERKQAEEALRRAKEAADRAAEAKSRFLAVMSHELRTPLTAVIGMADLLETEVVGPMNDLQRKHLASITTSAWHLVAIIDEVLTYSQADAGRTRVRLGTTDIAAITREVAAMLEFPAREKGVTLEVAGVDHPVFAFTDPGKIRQIVTNLVGNAVKFTDRGSVHVSVTGTDHQVQVQIRDTGPGIEHEMVEAVFEPFVQGDGSPTRKKGGAGLGLAVSRRLARLLGGDITLETVPGDGCTFTLQVPVEPDPETLRSEGSGAARAPFTR
jgi:two-component system, chemotaxis family, CheB/CheR fusion protein